MDSEQRHHNRSSNSTTGGGELFICFTSRLSSSSSMKISSKSILSPGRTREPTQISLSSSLSRRLRSNGSMKGGQASPMFPTAGKKKGCAFENPEPSSPKVTCIGQVRVKTKKQGKKMRSRSKRRGEVSFRRVEQSAADGATPTSDVVGQISRSYSQSHFNQQQEVLSQRNQRWVHLPMTICEALRAFGSDFNCFLPCRSSCMSSGEKTEKTAESAAGENDGSSTGTSCGAVFARWLVALHEGDGKGREIELVVGEEEEAEKPPEQGRSRSQRRHVFEDIDIGLESFEEEKPSKVVEEDGREEANRVSICVPPKNALLLMRCRSDPVKMAALANRFWESPLRKEEDDKEEHEEEEHEEETNEYQEETREETRTFQLETEHSEEEELEAEVETEHSKDDEPEAVEEKRVPDLVEQEEAAVSEKKANDLVTEEQKIPEHEDQEAGVNAAIEDCNREERETEVFVNEEPAPSPEATVLIDSLPSEDHTSIVEQEIEDIVEKSAPEEDVGVEENRASVPSSPSASVHSEPKAETESDPESEDGEEEKLETEPVTEAQVLAVMAEPVAETEEEMEESREEEEETVTCVRPVPEDPTTATTQEYEPGRKSNDSVSSQNQKRLPDCLLLMMCEPKLSMEVSKETWVCSTDFIRWLPERPPPVNKVVAKTNAPDEPKSRKSTDSNPAPPHPIKPSRRRSPNPLHQPPRSSCSFPAPARSIEQKPDGAKAYEPFVLTRCKSEPVKSASKLAQDGCFWNNRKLEPHRPGIGATGVGC